METLPIFTIALHKFFEPELAILSKKIVDENLNLFKKTSGNNAFTNFLTQNVSKHKIDENYKNLNEVLELKKIILKNALEVLTLYGYNSKTTEYEVTNLWFNIMETGAFQTEHHHYGFVLSGTFYIDIPSNSGQIVFSNPYRSILPYNDIISEEKKYNNFNSTIWNITPKDGEMYFWLSPLLHQVVPTQFDGSRISCSFDISSKN